MNNIISIGCCTWQRPKELKRMLDSLYATWDFSIPLDLIIQWMKNDPYIRDYHEIIYEHALSDYITPIMNSNDKESLPTKGNRVLYNESIGDFIIGVSDNVEFRTPYWNMKVRDMLSVYPDDLIVCYFNNGRGREKAEFLGMTRKWMDLQGFFIPTQFEHFSCDEYVEWVANQVGRLVFMKDIIFYHHHPKFGIVAKDESYNRQRRLDADGTNMSIRDALLYPTTLGERQALVRKIQDAIRES